MGLDTFKDPCKRAVASIDDTNLKFVLEFAELSEKMAAQSKGFRIRQLTKDASFMISHTCKGLVDIAKFLFESGKSFVLFGAFSTDPLEKYFSKLRQGSGGTYFIIAQSVIEKTNIFQSKLALNLNLQIDELSDGHHCSSCSRDLSVQEAEVLDNVFV